MDAKALVAMLTLGGFIVTMNSNEVDSEKYRDEENALEPSQFAGKTLNQAAEKIRKKYKAIPIGFGLGGTFHTMSLELEIREVLGIDEARLLLLESRKILLNEINSSDELKPHLDSSPFENADITLFIKNRDGSATVDPQICALYTSKGFITYLTNDPEDEYKYKQTFKETLEEAEAKNQEYIERINTGEEHSPWISEH